MQFFPVTNYVTANTSYWKPKEKFSVYILVAIALASEIWFKFSSVLCTVWLLDIVTCYATKDAVRIGNPFITNFSLVTTIIHN
jgi:hypothetical protein